MSRGRSPLRAPPPVSPPPARGSQLATLPAATDPSAATRFTRYVALGDSSTAGVGDPDGSGGYRGWSRRLAQRIADLQGSLEYANLAVLGGTTHEILLGQLAPALRMRPDLATVFSGTNDLVARRLDVASVAREMEAMQRALIEGGATVLTFTLPVRSAVLPIARLLAPRIHAINQAIRGAAASTGAILVDFSACAIAVDARIWSADRIHVNEFGHTRIADALADALHLPGSDGSWCEVPPPTPRKPLGAWLAGEAEWTREHLLPWIARGMRTHPPEVRADRERPMEIEILRGAPFPR